MNPSTARHRFFTFFHGAFFFLLLLLPSAMAQSNNNNNPQSPYVNPNFKPSMAVTIVVLCAAFVFIALFSLYIRRCSREPYMNRSIRGVNARSRRAPRGLDATVIETFPTFVYSVVKGLKIGKGTLECAVCLNEFEDDERLRLLPKCDHVFHPECIDAWLSSHTTCPVCRADLKVDSLTDTDAPVEGSVAVDGTATPEISESQEQVLINVNDGDSLAEVINPSEITSQNRPVRSKSTKTRMGGRFPRSHSTGHSFVQPGSADNFDRFTLRLPVEVRKQIIMNGKLNRSASCVTFVNRQGSVSGSRREGSVKGGLFGRFDRSGKADSWGFSMTAPFFWRNPSVRASRKGDSSLKPPAFQVGTKAAGVLEQSSSARPPV